MLIKNIRRLCIERGISIRQLERSVGLSNGIVASWEVKAPSVLKVKAVADYFGVTVDDLLTETGEEAVNGKTEDTDQ